MAPDFLDGRILRPVSHQDSDNGDLSTIVDMHQMEHHVVDFAPNVFLTRPMKMKVLKLIFLVSHDEPTSRGVANLNRMTVIGDSQGRLSVLKVDGGQARFSRSPDVDRRLRMAPTAIM